MRRLNRPRTLPSVDQTRRAMKMKQERGIVQKGGRAVTIRGDHRTYITRPQTEELPMVPGPKEVQ